MGQFTETAQTMENLLDTWFNTSKKTVDRKRLWRAVETDGGRVSVLEEVATRTRSHYVSDEEIASFLDALGYQGAAEVVRMQYPEGPKGRSADIGEILAAEAVEEWCGYEVPIRKLRYKDHREQAMRGEDVIGIKFDDEDQLYLLKGEAKSARALAEATVVKARAGLEANSGRPTGHAMVYLARKLIEGADERKREIGKKILRESIRSGVPKTRITHCIFLLTGNPATDMLENDFGAAGVGRDQFIIQLHVPDHAELIKGIYNKVIEIEVD